jgi:hypothetical protein
VFRGSHRCNSPRFPEPPAGQPADRLTLVSLRLAAAALKSHTLLRSAAGLVAPHGDCLQTQKKVNERGDLPPRTAASGSSQVSRAFVLLLAHPEVIRIHVAR